MHTATRKDITSPKRRSLMLGIAAIGLSGLSLAACTATPERVAVQVWKDPNCGCCKDWVAHLEENGFSVSVLDEGNAAARERLGMPQTLASCHTALINGYVIEGHVPAADIQRLLKEKPTALGLSVPGMPIGSPGMDGPAYENRRDPYDVLLVQKDGTSAVFNSYS